MHSPSMVAVIPLELLVPLVPFDSILGSGIGAADTLEATSRAAAAMMATRMLGGVRGW